MWFEKKIDQDAFKFVKKTCIFEYINLDTYIKRKTFIVKYIIEIFMIKFYVYDANLIIFLKIISKFKKVKFLKPFSVQISAILYNIEMSSFVLGS